jgi:Rrf2 family nitric oxide-sensitive transcriptional repressor
MVSQTSQYALRAVLFLASTGGGPVVAQDISDTTGVPKGYLHKILRRLGKAGILKAHRGVGGGYELVNNPSDLSVGEILKAIEPSHAVSSLTCQNGEPGNDDNSEALRRLLIAAKTHLDKIFESTSVQDLINDGTSTQQMSA